MSERILVVEDSDTAFGRIVIVLKKAGVDLSLIDHAEQMDGENGAIDFLNRVAYRLVLLDRCLDPNNIDNEDGLAVGEAMRSSAMNMFVYAISTSGMDSEVGNNPWTNLSVSKSDRAFEPAVKAALGLTVEPKPVVNVEKMFDDLDL